MTKAADTGPVIPMPASARRCPICGKRSVPRYRPFCSGRCADIDLGRWFKATYRVETEEPTEDGGEANEP
jgi:endogenous inhibitor of DNA gyrase (YacG/DUF329 family)